MKKNFVVFVLAILLVLTVIPNERFYLKASTDLLKYDVVQQFNDDTKTAHINMEFEEQENLLIEKILLPNGNEMTDTTTVDYEVSENGTFICCILPIE